MRKSISQSSPMFGKVELSVDLENRDYRIDVVLGNLALLRLQDAVDAKPDLDPLLVILDVNIAGAFHDGLVEETVDDLLHLREIGVGGEIGSTAGL